MKNTHPFEPFIPSGASKLIIGTIPPERFCINLGRRIGDLLPSDVNFYYGSRDNYFWELLDELYGFEFKLGEEGVKQRKEFLAGKGMGITDIIETCERAKNSSSDDALSDEKFKKISELLKEYPAITSLIYTSEQVKKYINQTQNTYHSIDKLDKKKQSVKIGNKIYEVWILFSPSPQALINMGKNGKERRKHQYNKVFAQI